MHTSFGLLVSPLWLAIGERAGGEGSNKTCGGENEGCSSSGPEDLLHVLDNRLGKLGEGRGTMILVASVHSPQNWFRHIGWPGHKEMVPPWCRIVLHCRASSSDSSSSFTGPANRSSGFFLLQQLASSTTFYSSCYSFFSSAAVQTKRKWGREKRSFSWKNRFSFNGFKLQQLHTSLRRTRPQYSLTSPSIQVYASSTAASTPLLSCLLNSGTALNSACFSKQLKDIRKISDRAFRVHDLSLSFAIM